MKTGQCVPYVLPSITYSAGASGSQTLRDLPKQYLGRLAHVSKFTFNVKFTPTHTTAPTTVGNNNVLTTVDFTDGSFVRFQGGFNHMRAREQLHTGRLRLPDTATGTASGTARYYDRVLYVGPPQFAGSPSDFVIPCGMLETGELRYKHGALTDLSADTTAATGTVRVVAWLMLLDEIRIPPAYRFANLSATAADINLPGRALYESVALLDSSAFGSFAADEVGDIRLDLGSGDVVPNVHRQDLVTGFLSDFAPGEFSTVNGDPEAATDTQGRIVNQASVTALAVAPNALQPVLWSPPETRITKMHLAESSVRMRWSGSQASGVVLYGRIESQPASVVATNVAKALGRLGLQQKSVKVKTLSKKAFTSPFVEFMPWKVEV
jgi:hypothetical protein